MSDDALDGWMRSFILEKSLVLTRRAASSCNLIHFNTKLHGATYRSWRVLSSKSTGKMKRKATESSPDSKPKRQKEPEADYCDVLPRKDSSENIIWPASEQAIKRTRDFLRDW